MTVHPTTRLHALLRTLTFLQVMHVLKALYDNDIVAEEIILAWHSRPGTGKALGVLPADAEKVRKAAAPYIEWLEEEAEEDSEEESDEDDED